MLFLQSKNGMGELMNDAIFSMAEAKFSMGDFNQMILNNTDKAQLKAIAKKDNVAGFFLLFIFSTVNACFCVAVFFCFCKPKQSVKTKPLT